MRIAAATIARCDGPTWAMASRKKWIRQRRRVAPRTPAAAAFRPSWASEITSLTPRRLTPRRLTPRRLTPRRLTPRRPRRVRPRRKAVQNGPASEGPTAGPSTSRRPSVLTATAIMTATGMMRPASRSFT